MIGAAFRSPIELDQNQQGDLQLPRQRFQSSRDGGDPLVGARLPIVAFDESDSRLEIGLPQEEARYIAEKGSIAVNGISLTVAEVKPASFVTWIIPHTRHYTNLKTAQPGELVNLEFDILAKYVERMVGAGESAVEVRPGKGAVQALRSA